MLTGVLRVVCLLSSWNFKKVSTSAYQKCPLTGGYKWRVEWRNHRVYNLVSDYGSVHLREVSVSGGSAPSVLATQYNDSQQ